MKHLLRLSPASIAQKTQSHAPRGIPQLSRLSGLGFGLKVREIWETFMCLLGAHGCGGFTSYECLVSLETLFSTSSLILGLGLGFRVRAKES